MFYYSLPNPWREALERHQAAERQLPSTSFRDFSLPLQWQPSYQEAARQMAFIPSPFRVNLQGEPEQQVAVERAKLRYAERAELPTSTQEQLATSLFRTLERAAQVAWYQGDEASFWRHREQLARERQRQEERMQRREREVIEEQVSLRRAQLRYAEAAHLPWQTRESLRLSLIEALRQAAESAASRGELATYFQRFREIAQLQEFPSPFQRLARRIIGWQGGRETPFAPLELLRELGTAPAARREAAQLPEITIRLELTEGLKASLVESSGNATVKLLTRIVQGMS